LHLRSAYSLSWNAPRTRAAQDQFLAGGGLVPGAAALGDVPDPAAHLAGVAAQVGAGDRGRAAVRFDECGQHPQRGGLAGAVGPEKSEDLALGDVQVDAADGLDDLLLAPLARCE
jgi:hypothetical protein